MPVTIRNHYAVPHFSISQHDVTFELATLLPSTLLVTDICNKTYGNLLCVATGCSGCKNSTAVLVEKLYTGLVDFVGWSLVLNFTEAHGGFLNFVNKLFSTNNLILRCIGLEDKCVAGGKGKTTTL